MKLLRLVSTLCAALGLQFAASAQTISFTGSPLSQTFDGMGTNGTTTPSGWFVASNAAAVINFTTNVTASAGATGPAGGVRGFNLGTSNTTDRALGTGPTGSNRYMEARIRNNSIFGIDTITVNYDGEQWRNGNNSLATNANRLVLQYSTDGVTYVDMGAAFDFTQLQDAPINTRLDGNDPLNRTAGLGGIYTPASVVQPGSTIFLRWFDANELQTDPIIAIDNFSFSATTISVPVTIVITSPTNGQTFAESADIPVTTLTGGSISNVAFFVDGTFVSTDNTTPFAGTIPTALLPLGNHTITAFATNTMGVMEASAIVDIIVVPNQPPTIAITNTLSGAVVGTTFLVGSAITVQASVIDDAGVTNVDWFVDGNFYVTRTNAPFTFIYNDSLAGAHTFQGIATDRGGLQTTSAIWNVNVTNPPANFDLLITNSSAWSYFNTSNEPAIDGNGFLWTDFLYDDSLWAVGLGEIGGGDRADGYPETTTIDIGPVGNRYRTVYFRRFFDVSNPGDYGQVVLRLLRDDGAVVHLNGAPIWTNNIPAATNGPVVYSTLAASAADNGTIYQVFNFSPSLLQFGQNSFAVEIHQTTATSSDLSFDLMLWGEKPTVPLLTITAPTNGQSFVESMPVTVNVAASTFVTNVTLLVDGNPVGDDGTRPFSIVASNLSVGSHTLVARGLDSYLVTGDSAPVTINITPNQPPVITITNVFSRTTNSPAYLVGSAITNQYRVTDDLSITNVDFFVDGVLVHRDAAGFGQVVVNDALAGLHTYTARAYDRLGLTADSSVMVNITNPPYTLLLTNGCEWRYEDSGATQAVEWVNLGFDDSLWGTGFAELGFGDAVNDTAERTLLRPNSGLFDTNSLVYYFRKIIDVANPAAYTNLIISVLRDDGARIFINSNAVFTTPAAFPPTAAAGDDGTVYFRANISPTNLVAGQNIIAVEVRQNAANSSDLSFDLMLWGEEGPVMGPPLTITTDGVTVTVSHGGVAGFRLQRSTDIGSPANWMDVPGNPLSLNFTIASEPGPLFFRLVSP
jgi:Bacterial Ig domain